MLQQHYAPAKVLQARWRVTENTPYCHASNSPEVLGVTGSFLALALITVILRLHVRAYMLHCTGADDYAMLGAALMAIATMICFVGETRYGIGRHIVCADPAVLTMKSHWSFFHNLWPMFGLVLVKISIALFLLRLAPRSIWRKCLWGIIGFLVAFGLAAAFTLIFGCHPIAAFWNWSLFADPRTACFSVKTIDGLALFNSIVTIVTDLFFAIAPIFVVIRLHVDLRTKTSLAIVLGLGFVTCAAGITKATYQWRFVEDEDRDWHDSFEVWFMIELCLGIIAASLPALKPLLKSVLASTRSGGAPTSSTWMGKTPAGYYSQCSDERGPELMRSRIALAIAHGKTDSFSAVSSRGDFEVEHGIALPHRAQAKLHSAVIITSARASISEFRTLEDLPEVVPSESRNACASLHQ
ncbi:hypothetical protein EJ03DRAFT_111465 [Teratosphaeria nubilosa]|uniref:Rhodopsin domain-containing protein n=1 Tax=Teratosphaeria nubilosa TaxID=161662 RepID=A0A6G1L8J8_9PEZI|nr:hypothetical protein EJ03DRAFT_111465 [Teratosphaeria nubilosa]